MKHETSNEKMANGQQSQDIQNTPAIKFQITVHGNSAPGIFPAILPPFAARQGTDGCSNTIRGHHIGKAPPGRARAPGRARGHPPANKAGPPDQTIHKPEASPLATCREENVLPLGGAWLSHQTTFFNSNNPIINTKTSINFINNLNFKIMKKQILILALFVMAMFASVSNSYAACLEDPLHPIAGKPYTYGITVAGYTAVTYTWIVTDNPAVLTTGALVTGLTQGATTYTMTGDNTATPTITWSPQYIALALANTKQYYVVVKYAGHNTAGNCDASNVKAYRIRPANQFYLDVANADNSGAAASATFSVCPADLVTATITENANLALDPKIAYNYGVTNLYFRVTATNFTGAWNLTVNRSALAGLVGATEAFAMTWGTTVATSGANAIADDLPVSIAEQTATATDAETIIVRVTYTHNTYEGLAAKTLALVANATDQAGNPDVSAVDCTPEVDTVTQILNARPDVITNTTATPNTFIQP